ncbi:MAG TPA: TetR/AcrR family transcriptional regulator [Kofleriaceae bacterium]|nr:TetR/AcrR family transcriptional regulator [Kofleriaceae bacterium]
MADRLAVKRQERRDVRQERRADRRDDRKDRREERRDDREERAQRRRRSPEVARQELLDAAERLFAKDRPDDVGLKDIAREAGTSHALITHYFGTYAGLVESVLQRRLQRLRNATAERLREAGVLSRVEELLAILFRTLDDPVHVRLMQWVMASGRQQSLQVLALQDKGLQMIAHQVAHAVVPQPTREIIEKIELSLVTSVAAALGYAFSKAALAGAIGQQPSEQLDRRVQQTLAAMIEAYTREVIG